MENSLVILKPGVDEESILQCITENGFKIINRRRVLLTKDQAIDLFQEHTSNKDFVRLIKYMISSPVLGLVVSKPNVHEELKSIIGDELPETAKASNPKSIRAIHGTDYVNNAIYASDAVNAQREITFFFPDSFVEKVPMIEMTKGFVENAVYPTLREGLTELAKLKPANPTAWLGNWLLENNPYTPKIEEPVS